MFLTKLKELDSEKIVYIDESGIDSSLYREYARSERGKRVKADIFGKRSERTSLISGWIHEAKEFICQGRFKSAPEGGVKVHHSCLGNNTIGPALFSYFIP